MLAFLTLCWCWTTAITFPTLGKQISKKSGYQFTLSLLLKTLNKQQTQTTEQTLLISCRIFASYNMFQVRVGMKNEWVLTGSKKEPLKAGVNIGSLLFFVLLKKKNNRKYLVYLVKSQDVPYKYIFWIPQTYFFIIFLKDILDLKHLRCLVFYIS